MIADMLSVVAMGLMLNSFPIRAKMLASSPTTKPGLYGGYSANGKAKLHLEKHNRGDYYLEDAKPAYLRVCM